MDNPIFEGAITFSGQVNAAQPLGISKLRYLEMADGTLQLQVATNVLLDGETIVQWQNVDVG